MLIINQDVIKKHEDDIVQVKKFLSSKFNALEIQEKGIVTQECYAHNGIDENLFIVEGKFIIDTKNINCARKISTDLTDLMQKNINVITHVEYFYKNIDKLIDDLMIKAFKIAKNEAFKIAQIYTKKMDCAKSFQAHFESFKLKNIDISINAKFLEVYFFQSNPSQIFQNLIIEAIKNSKTKVEQIAKSDEKKVLGLRRIFSPSIKFDHFTIYPKKIFYDFCGKTKVTVYVDTIYEVA